MKICIDAGHGYSNRTDNVYDPGAVAKGIEEADIVLSWALTGKWMLHKAGIPYFLTRDSDTDEAPLNDRVKWAEENKCTHLISLHCNAAKDFTVYGAEAFYRAPNDKSKSFAMDALDCAAKAIKTVSRGVKMDRASHLGRFAILDFDGVATLLELGFITNTLERNRLLMRDSRILFWETFIGGLK